MPRIETAFTYRGEFEFEPEKPLRRPWFDVTVGIGAKGK
jgi:hypothetical protein